jgi:tRNA modification GTPase
MISSFHDTIAALSTSEGRSALAIVRISGTDAIQVLSKIVEAPELLWTAKSSSSVYVRIGEVDEVVVNVFRAPRSYTGEDLCEITSHGAGVITRQILELLLFAGARQAEPGEFSRRAFFNGKIGIEEAELIAVKAEAVSERSLRGAELAIRDKYDRLNNAYNRIISLIASIDAEIDFGDSDHINIDDFDARVSEVISSLNILLKDSSNRRENSAYFTVALTGPPNVGKSSVFNALLNFERSIVSEIPGTTRDYVEAFIDVDGFRVKLVDTAGVRDSNEAIESRGISLGVDAARHADISFRVTDPDDRFPALENGSVLLHNKIDLDDLHQDLYVSALTGEGIESLHSWLAAELNSMSSELSGVSLSESERLKIESVVESLRTLNIDLEPPLLAEELRISAENLATLLGKNVGNDSLDYIFTKMCIGK